MTALPPLFHVRQTFPRPRVDDVGRAAEEELGKLGLGRTVRPGQRVGILVGSRGIAGYASLLRAAIAHVRGLGAEPSLLAAMGSHGGGTEAGQAELLASLGVTEAELGAPVRTCVDSVLIGEGPSGLPLYTLRSALEVDAILPVNRVKTHTSFKGELESGIVKMVVVGLGGPLGAQGFHQLGPRELPRLLVDLGRAVLAALPVVGGLAVVENAYEETAAVRGLATETLVAEEAKLLAWSKTLSPALPDEELDLLVIEEMGKNFSGTGIDTNVVGRLRIQGQPEPEAPRVKRLAVLGLSEASHGNATGVGLADFVTKALVDRVDREKTYLNCLTSTFVVRAAIPMTFDTEGALVAAALRSLAGVAPERLRIVVIPNTLFLEESLVSGPIARELEGRPGVTVDPAPRTLAFDGDGRLQPRLSRAAG